MAFMVILAVPLILLACAVLAREVTLPVTRARVERFARRQRLVITPDNGARVMEYLATTRRWRASGLVLGALGGLLWSLPDGKLTLSFTALFGGWFVGAVIAEWRVAALPSGERRSALLQPRQLRDYLGPLARALPATSAAACTALAVANLAGSLRQDTGLILPIVAWTAAAGVGLALVTAIQRHVLVRRQSPAAADVLAADDAIRSRSVRVLAGSAVAAAGFPAASLVAMLSSAYPSLDQEAAAGTSLVLLCVAALAGWRVAVAPSRVRRDVPAWGSERVGGVTGR